MAILLYDSYHFLILWKKVQVKQVNREIINYLGGKPQDIISFGGANKIY